MKICAPTDVVSTRPTDVANRRGSSFNIKFDEVSLDDPCKETEASSRLITPHARSLGISMVTEMMDCLCVKEGMKFDRRKAHNFETFFPLHPGPSKSLSHFRILGGHRS